MSRSLFSLSLDACMALAGQFYFTFTFITYKFIPLSSDLLPIYPLTLEIVRHHDVSNIGHVCPLECTNISKCSLRHIKGDDLRKATMGISKKSNQQWYQRHYCNLIQDHCCNSGFQGHCCRKLIQDHRCNSVVCLHCYSVIQIHCCNTVMRDAKERQTWTRLIKCSSLTLNHKSTK